MQGVKRKGSSRGQWFPVGTGFSPRSACLPGQQAAATHRRSSGTRHTRQVCPPPRLSRREQVPPPAPPLPQTRRLAAAGRGKGHFGAEWKPKAMWRRGAWRRHSLPCTRAQPPPPPARRSAPSSPHLSPPARRALDPRPADPPPSPERPGRGTLGEGGGGRSLRAAPAGARASVARERGGGREGQTLQTRKWGGGAPFRSSPQDRRANEDLEAGRAPGKFIWEKPSTLGAGRLKKLKPRSGSPATPGGDGLSPRPPGRIRPSCGWGCG